MNKTSHSPNESQPEITVHPKQVYRWWQKNNGSEKSPFEKSHLTKKHMADRALWIETWRNSFFGILFPVCCLDEKLFYTSTCRRKKKHLPRHKIKLSGVVVLKRGVDVLKRLKCWSRKFSINIMYLGVVGRPCTVNGRKFNGWIMIERIG